MGADWSTRSSARAPVEPRQARQRRASKRRSTRVQRAKLQRSTPTRRRQLEIAAGQREQTSRQTPPATKAGNRQTAKASQLPRYGDEGVVGGMAALDQRCFDNAGEKAGPRSKASRGQRGRRGSLGVPGLEAELTDGRRAPLWPARSRLRCLRRDEIDKPSAGSGSRDQNAAEPTTAAAP